MAVTRRLPLEMKKRAAFHAEARKRLAKMKKSGMGIPADEVRAYFRELAAGGNPPPPKPRKIA